MTDTAIRVQNLSKCYQIYDTPRDRLKQFFAPRLQRLAGQTSKQYFREFWAPKDVSFEIKKGEAVGIIGRNGKIQISEPSLLGMIKRNVDALLFATERREFLSSDFDAVKAMLKQSVLFDRQNLYASATLNEQGFEYGAIGWKV